MSKTYCAFPWTNLNVSNFNQMMPCCNFTDPPEVFTTPEDFFYGEYMNNLRSDMLAGKQIKGCQNCYFNEEAGLDSERTKANKMYGKVEVPELRVLDIMLDNVCNLKCRMCNSSYSHSWKNDEISLYGRALDAPKYNKNTYIDDLDLSKIERIVLQGGEPLYSPQFEKILDKLNEQNTLENMELWISTNATIIPSKKSLDYIKRFKVAQISLSLDGYDKLFEYIRKNAKFNEVKKVLDFFHSIADDRITFSINFTTTIYNVNHVEEIREYYSKNYPKFHWHQSYLIFPEELCITNTPPEFKEQIKNIISDQDVIDFMNNSDNNLFKYFIYYTETLDKIRKESIEESNPWLWNFINNYKERASVDEASEFYNNVFNTFWTRE